MILDQPEERLIQVLQELPSYEFRNGDYDTTTILTEVKRMRLVFFRFLNLFFLPRFNIFLESKSL